MSTTLEELLNRTAVIDAILGIAGALDRKDWTRIRSLLADRIHTDYSQFRGEPAAIVCADDYVESRKRGLDGLATVHFSTNHEVELRGDEATCRSAYLIVRVKTDNAAQRLDSAGHHEHALKRSEQGWRVTAIRQTLVSIEGDRSIHGAFASKPD